MDLKGFDIEHWWKLLAGSGAAIVVASIAVKFTPTIFVGLGALVVGIAEWINHPLQTRVGHGYTLTSHNRKPFAAGLVLDGIGLVLFAIGLLKLVQT